MISVIPKDGVPVRDPRLVAFHGGPSIFLTAPISLPKENPAAQQLLRHVRRGELLPGNELTAAMAGVTFQPPPAAAKGKDR